MVLRIESKTSEAETSENNHNQSLIIEITTIMINITTAVLKRSLSNISPVLLVCVGFLNPLVFGSPILEPDFYLGLRQLRFERD